MLQVYRYLTYFLFPLLIILIYFRSIFRKEDKTRYKEKIFSSHFNVSKSDNKKLVWFHAASIGECLSIVPLIDEINNKHEKTTPKKKTPKCISKISIKNNPFIKCQN